MLTRLVHLLVYLIVRVLICIVQAVPLGLCHAGARGLAVLFADVLRVRHRVVDENLAFAFPDLSPGERRRLARRMWEHLFLMAAEVAHVPRKIHETNWHDYIHMTNPAPLVRAMIDDRPVIILSGHFGNFELGSYLMGLFGFPTFAVARELDNPYLHRFIGRFRGLSGQQIIPKNGGYDQIVDVLSHGGTLALLADQYAGTKGCWVEFFGRPASTHKAIALLALQYDAPLALGYARRLGGPLRYEFATAAMIDPREVADQPDAVRRLTQWYTRELERLIRRAPEQYWWLHNRWKDHRPRRGRKAA